MSSSTSISGQIKVYALVAGAIVVTLSLAWNNAITALINKYIPEQYADSNNAWVKLAYALGLTMLTLGIVNYFSL
jgi:intracellular septation protein A